MFFSFYRTFRLNSINCEMLIDICLVFIAEVGAAGCFEAEVGTIRGDARRLPNAHPQQIVDAAHL